MNVKEKYEKVKLQNSNIDHDLVKTFIEEMPGEALLLFDKMLYGCHIGSRELYEVAVDNLYWVEDKGHGAKWTIDEITRVCNIDFESKLYTKYDLCFLVNYDYAKYCNLGYDAMQYVKMAKNDLENENIRENPEYHAYKVAKKLIKMYE